MDTSRLTPADISAGVGGIVLLISLWLPWYGVSVNVSGFSASSDASGWEVFSTIDIILFLIAVAAIVLVVLKAADQLPAEVPVPYTPRVGRSKVTGTVRGTVRAVSDMRAVMRQVRPAAAGAR